MNLIPKNLSQLRRIALAVLLASFAILDTTSISAQEPGRTITSPFGVANPYMNASDASESGTDGDTFVDPETGEVGHIIRNPFGVANPEGVDTGIDIPDSEEEEVGGIITNPFGVPDPDGIDTGVDVFDEDEEYLISLPDDEESEVEDSEDVDEIDDAENEDETSDDVKELEGESYEATTEKYVPVIDNPTRGVEYPTIIFSLVGTCGGNSVTSDPDSSSIPTLNVPFDKPFTIYPDLLEGSWPSGNPTWTISASANNPILSAGVTDLTEINLPSTPEHKTIQTAGIPYGEYTISATAVVAGINYTQSINIKINGLNLLIDSDNNGVIDFNDKKHDNLGKIIGINNLDIDRNEIPNFADGFDCLNGGESATGKSAPFTELKLSVSSQLTLSDYSIELTFAESPYTVTRKPTGITSHPYYYIPPDQEEDFPPDAEKRQLRIWTKNGGEARLKAKITESIPGHRVPPNERIPLNILFSDNNREVTLYVEAINPSKTTTGNQITAKLYKSTEVSSDSVKAIAVKVDSVTPNETSDGSKAIKIMIETDINAEKLIDPVSYLTTRYYTTAQKSDHQVNITATIEPQISGVPVYFEVIDPDDLSPYEGKTYAPETNSNIGNENLFANDNLDVDDVNNKKSMKAPSNYAIFQNACLREVGDEDRFTRYATTNDSGEATIRLDITNKCSGDNYIVRASCVNPDIAPNELRPFDKYSTEPPPTLPSSPSNGNEINNILDSLQYEDETTIAQTALLVAWKRTYIEHANMYKKGATVTVEASGNSSSLTVDNPSDFSGESSPGEGDGSEITIFLPPNGATSYVRRVVSISGNNIILNNSLPVIIPKYSGIIINNETSHYSSESYTSYLTNAYGGDPGGLDGGAFIEFKDINIHYVPKYTEFPNATTMYKYGEKWFIHNQTVNVMLLVAATRRSDGILGGTGVGTNQSFILVESHLNQYDENTELFLNVIRDTVTHKIGHIWDLAPETVDQHIDSKYIRKTNHEETDQCFMSYTTNDTDSVEELCLDCLMYLRNKNNF